LPERALGGCVRESEREAGTSRRRKKYDVVRDGPSEPDACAQFDGYRSASLALAWTMVDVEEVGGEDLGAEPEPAACRLPVVGLIEEKWPRRATEFDVEGREMLGAMSGQHWPFERRPNLGGSIANTCGVSARDQHAFVAPND
jgi:hypothetical protein